MCGSGALSFIGRVLERLEFFRLWFEAAGRVMGAMIQAIMGQPGMGGGV